MRGIYLFRLFLVLVAGFCIAAYHNGTRPIIRTVDYEGTSIETDSLRDIYSGRLLYHKACAQCHGINGKGRSGEVLGLSVAVPDFSDCDFSSREPDADWIAVVHEGGPVRAFSREMPAFGDALTLEEIEQVMLYIRSLCIEKEWPRGELNLPRAQLTEKAYPEDEAVLSTYVDVEDEGTVNNELVYEHRFGARNQFEIAIPFGFRETASGNWAGGQLGDIAIGVKRALYHNINSGSIFSASGEFILPTGDRSTGYGKGTTIFEPFVSYGQILPFNSFFQFQGGAEFPLLRDKASEEVFWRGVWGTSLTQGQWGRTWSPMVELVGSREFESGAENHWNIVPQMQVTINKRQHIMLNAGVEIPLDDASRDTRIMVYLLWDWFDGGIFEGW